VLFNMKSKRKKRPPAHLIFIDTNIYLDFYRQSKDAATESLDLIDKNRDKIICCFQVEMEFKKNRHKVIFDSFKQLKNPEWGSLTPPSIFADSEPASIIEASKDKIDKQHKKLRKRLTDLLDKPAVNDDVYKVLQRLFRNECDLNLHHDDTTTEITDQILKEARIRFERGLPPRKKDENSFGDAINWEWMVRCSEKKNSNLIIVSRDQDYGLKFHDKMVINDWLLAEFKARVNQQKKVILTDRLSEAFKFLRVSMSAKTESEEKRIIGEQASNLNLPFEQSESPSVEKLSY
jgi:hypothetical protein